MAINLNTEFVTGRLRVDGDKIHKERLCFRHAVQAAVQSDLDIEVEVGDWDRRIGCAICFGFPLCEESV